MRAAAPARGPVNATLREARKEQPDVRIGGTEENTGRLLGSSRASGTDWTSIPKFSNEAALKKLRNVAAAHGNFLLLA
jgi:hypothetical protein